MTLPMPTVTPPTPWAFPEATTRRLDNGLTLISYDIPGQYVISIRLAVPAPLDSEPLDREGVGVIMSRTLDEGTHSHTGEEFAELLERKGIALGAGMAETGLVIDVDVAQRHLGPALELLTECVSEPSFPTEEVSRHVKTRMAEIEQEHASAGSRASLEFIRTWFALDERASRPAGGTRETVAAITPTDVAQFHRAHVRPAGATMVVAGDLADLDVLAEVERTIGAWSVPGDVDLAPVPLPTPTSEARRADDAFRIVFVDRPDSVQTELVVGAAGPDRGVTGGWAPYPVLGFVLGGSPGARIDALLREDKGFTYGIRSAFRPRHDGGLFLTTGSVRADVTAEALGLLLDLLDTARDGFTVEEARSGVDFIGKTAPGRYATAGAVADEAVMLALLGLTTDFTTANLQDLRTVDTERLRAAYDRYVTGEWAIVLVGDAGLYAESVRALDRGQVTVV